MEYYYNEAEPKPMPMKWYKFIIYFQLFVSALTYLFTAVGYFSFLWDKRGIDLGFLFYGNKLKILNLVMGLLNLFIVVFMLYTRHCLTLYKKGAPKKYLFCLCLALINAAVYLTGTYLVTGVLPFVMEDGMMLVEAGIMIILNYIYFKKREHLFVY